MTTYLPDPERWTDRPSGSESAEDLLGAAFRGARAATAPSEALLASVGAGFSPHVPVGIGPRRWRLAMVALAGLLAIGGTVGAARGPLLVWATRHGFIAPASPPLAPPRRPRPLVLAATPMAKLAEPRVPIDPASSPVRARLYQGATEPAPVRVREEAAPPAAAEEARILQGVFRELRSEAAGGDAAIAALDDYDRRFPLGLLRSEARLARVEALLELGRRSEALALLDATDPGGASLTRRARLARGELRADFGRCAEAAEDFATVLATSAKDDLGGRALYGRASCSLRAGDSATASAALTHYLDGHPDGPRASEAREALARLPVPAPSP